MLICNREGAEHVFDLPDLKSPFHLLELLVLLLDHLLELLDLLVPLPNDMLQLLDVGNQLLSSGSLNPFFDDSSVPIEHLLIGHTEFNL